MSNKRQEEFNSIVLDIINNKKFNKLKKELHHGITRFEHSMRVARWTYRICNLLKIKNRDDIIKASLLHDFYINDDLISNNGVSKLGEHPKAALENSKKYFHITDLQADIIKKHMFPCNLDIPTYKESWLVSCIDKVVGAYEIIKFKSALYVGIYALFTFEIIKLQR